MRQNCTVCQIAQLCVGSDTGSFFCIHLQWVFFHLKQECTFPPFYVPFTILWLEHQPKCRVFIITYRQLSTFQPRIHYKFKITFWIFTHLLHVVSNGLYQWTLMLACNCSYQLSWTTLQHLLLSSRVKRTNFAKSVCLILYIYIFIYCILVYNCICGIHINLYQMYLNEQAAGDS